jgi:hypothetical protein
MLYPPPPAPPPPPSDPFSLVQEREQLEPQFLIQGQTITVKLGDTVVLPCKVANLGECLVRGEFAIIYMTECTGSARRICTRT